MSGSTTTAGITGRALGALKTNVASLPPSCFAVVMASGIVSVGAYHLGFHGPTTVVMGFALAV